MENSEKDLPITRAEVFEVLKNSSIIRLQEWMRFALNPYRLWMLLAHLADVPLETMPLIWQLGVVVPMFKERDCQICCNIRGIMLLCLSARVQVRRVPMIVKPPIQEEQQGFHPGYRTLDQPFSFTRSSTILPDRSIRVLGT